MDYDMTANPAGSDDTRPVEDASAEAGAKAYYPDEEMIDTPGDGAGNEIDATDGDMIADVDYEGTTYQVPAPLKDALLRQADYTRKTMELADQRRALADHRSEIEQIQAMTVDEFRVISRLDQIDRELAELAQHDWSNLHPNHPDLAQLRAVAGELTREQAGLHGALNEHHHHKSAREQHDAARTRAETNQAMAREIQDWSPERRHALESFAVHHGVPEDHLDHASPAEMRLLHLAYLGAQQMERQRAANRGAVRPAAEVGGGAGAGPSDPSRMTMDQYRAWRAKQK